MSTLLSALPEQICRVKETFDRIYKRSTAYSLLSILSSNQTDLWISCRIISRIVLQEGGGAFGVNRWDAATFDNDLDRQKFNKLMGVKSEGNQPVEQSMQADDERGVLSADQQARVLTDVETHFMQGLRRADGRKVGLGL